MKIKKSTQLMLTGVFGLIVMYALYIFIFYEDTIVHLKESTLNHMVYIEGGTYTMGPEDPRYQIPSEYPPHKVTLSNFYISDDNVTYGEFDQYSDLTWSTILLPKLRNRSILSRSSNHPVEYATWHQAHDYCKWLASKTQLPLSLPTEAQWEYVARNHGKKDWFYATNNGKLEIDVNYPVKMNKLQKGNHGEGYIPMPRGSMPCIPIGVCGLNGAVNQWVGDWYSQDYYKESPKNNPQGPRIGKLKIIRSGGSHGSPEFNHNFMKYPEEPDRARGGFRCVINSADVNILRHKSSTAG